MTTPIKSDVDPSQMTYWRHGWEKCKQQPLVPIGAAATTVALLGATASLRSGNRRSFQHFLRARVVAQGVTVVAMVVGAFALTNKPANAKAARDRAIRGQLPPDEPEQQSIRVALQTDAPPVAAATSSTSPTAAATATTSSTDPAQVRVQDSYPSREKVKASEFTKRLREAERLQKEDDAAAAAAAATKRK